MSVIVALISRGTWRKTAYIVSVRGWAIDPELREWEALSLETTRSGGTSDVWKAGLLEMGYQTCFVFFKSRGGKLCKGLLIDTLGFLQTI